MRIAFIGGTSIVHSPLFSTWAEQVVETEYGEVALKHRDNLVAVNRHAGGPAPLPPHRINHRANIAALAKLGCADVVSFNSVGSLRADLVPGTFVSCSDYVDLLQGPATFHDAEIRGTAPMIANNRLPQFVAALAPEFSVLTGQTYVQTRGPRFETKAEIRVIRHWGDVVGMTLAHEADLCAELGLRLNSLGIVDNFANGLADTVLDHAGFKQNVRDHQARVDRFLTRVLASLSL